MATAGKDGMLRTMDRETRQIIFEAAITTRENADVPVGLTVMRIVLDELAVPAEPAGPHVERHDRVGVEIRTLAQVNRQIGCGVGDRDMQITRGSLPAGPSSTRSSKIVGGIVNVSPSSGLATCRAHSSPPVSALRLRR